MPLFNPFDKPFDKIEYDDLSQLSQQGVSEGFYVEYKSQMPSNKKVAKAISSFANTEGGIFFLGIEDDDEHNVPVAFDGMDISGKTETKEQIRNVVNGRINPPPVFRTRLYPNPHEEDQAVVMVTVPRSSSTPHVTNTGRIYRRVGEGTDPYDYATDSKTIDKLTQRRESRYQNVIEFCRPDVSFTQGQDDWEFIEMYGVPSTLNELVCPDVVQDLDGFRDQFSRTELDIQIESDDGEDLEFSLELDSDIDSVQTTSNGVTVHIWNRDNRGLADVTHTPTTFTFFTDGSMKCLMPIPIISDSAEYPFIHQAVDQEFNTGTRNLSLIDGANLIIDVYYYYSVYLHILEEYGWFNLEGGSLEMKIKSNNIYRSVLGFESDWYKNYVSKYGIPICYENDIPIPRSGTMNLPVNKEEAMFKGFSVGQNILEGFGISWDNKEEVMYDIVGEMEEQSDEWVVR